MRLLPFAVPLVLVLATPLAPAVAADPVPLVASVCGAVEVRAGSDGVVRGFASGSCSQAGVQDGVVRYLERRAGAWSVQDSPYAGSVLGVADNGRETFLMYENDTGVRVTKRSHDGTFAGPGWKLAGGPSAGGDLTTVSDGFFAVWVRPSATPEGLDMVSWGRHDGYLYPRTVVTDNSVPDVDPVLTTNSKGVVELLWTRVHPDRSVVRIAEPTDFGWTSRALTGQGTHNERADVAAATGGAIWASWSRDGGAWGTGRPMVATDERGAFTATTLPGGTGADSHVAVSALDVRVVAYVLSGRVVLARWSPGAWRCQTLATAGEVADLAVTGGGSPVASVLFTRDLTAEGNVALHVQDVPLG